MASAELSAAITEAWAISTGVSERGGRRREAVCAECSAGASGRVDVIARFCQPPPPATDSHQGGHIQTTAESSSRG